MWVLIDNYDSFTYILYHYLVQTGHTCKVIRNDEISVAELEQLSPSRIIISPGPGTPLQSGVSMEAIRHFHNRIPILGICLGHQALGMFFGARLTHAAYPMHGKTSSIVHQGHPLFEHIPNSFEGMRYHSLIIDQLEGTGLQSIAYAEDDHAVMAVVHDHYPCTGIQFHPESIGTAHGWQIISNWAEQGW